MKRVIICDEEMESVSKLSTMIGQIFPKQFLLHGYVSAKQLFYEIEDGFIRTADIIFLSMEIKQVTEIDFAVYIQQKFPMAQIIFLAEDLQQVEAMFDEISPDGLLLKPLNRQRLEKCAVRKKWQRRIAFHKTEWNCYLFPDRRNFICRESGTKIADPQERCSHMYLWTDIRIV